MNTADNNSIKSKVSNGWLWGPILFVITTIPIYYLVICLNINGTTTSSERGIFGDTFGAVNALFTGLAFAIMTYTMMMQRNELEFTMQHRHSSPNFQQIRVSCQRW